MKITSLKKIKPKELIVFDLDGTLVATKSNIDKEMLRLVTQLLVTKKVAVIGGGKYQIFKTLFLRHLKISKKFLKNLFLFPTTSTTFYRYKAGWQKIYEHQIPKRLRKKIKQTFDRVFEEMGYEHPKKTYGEIVEDRLTQVTFSVYGQDIVKALGKKGVQIKKEWKRKHTPLKIKMGNLMAKYLPELEVRTAGYTSVDVTKKGIDKAFGLRQIEKHLGVKIKNMLFVGDAIYPGGNDYAIIRTGVDYISVKDPEQVKKIIRHLLKSGPKQQDSGHSDVLAA